MGYFGKATIKTMDSLITELVNVSAGLQPNFDELNSLNLRTINNEKLCFNA